MKISCLPVSLFPQIIDGSMSIGDWARMGAELGLDAIDLSVMFLRNHTPVYLNRIRKEIEASGLPIAMITAYPDFTHPCAIQRERELAYFRHDIALCSDLGATYLRILAGQAHPDTPVEEGIQWVIESFKQVAPVADKLNVTLLFENHSKPGAWDYVDFSHPTELFLRIVEGTEDTGIGINFDTGNTLVYGDDPMPVLQKVMSRVETIHAADTATRGKLEPVLLGEGIVPFAEIFSFLRQEKFDGWICMEEASGAGKEGIRKAADFVRKTWAEA